MCHVSKIECMVSGMPHILEYCGALSLLRLHQTSWYFNETISPLLNAKKASFPVSVQIDDVTINSIPPRVTYCNALNRMNISCKFITPLVMSRISDTGLSCIFHVCTPFDVWGYHEHIGAYQPVVISNCTTGGTTGGTTDSTRTIAYLDIYDVGTTKMKLLCEYIHVTQAGVPDQMTDFTITGMDIQYDVSPVYKLSVCERTLLLLVSMFSVVAYGPCIGGSVTVFVYKSIVAMNNASDSMYREKRLNDW